MENNIYSFKKHCVILRYVVNSLILAVDFCRFGGVGVIIKNTVCSYYGVVYASIPF